MSKYEKLGSFILFEKIEEDRLSKSFLAGQVINNQIQGITVVKKFDRSLSTLADFILDLNQEYEVVKSIANPGIIKPSVFVQERSDFAAVFDYVEGKTLRSVLSRCVQEGFPFTVDHSLLIASRLCTSIEYLHSKKLNEDRLIHGFVCPETVLITYDGEIKLQYFGLAHALLKFSAGRDKFFHDYRNYLAPELLNQQTLDRSVDVFGAGLTLFEMLTGEALFAKGRNTSIAEAVENSQMSNNSGDRIPVPTDIKKVILQALALEPAQRYSSIAEMRKELDLLLFSSEFSPTTFNLAFFMHSIFRDSIDEEAKNLNNYRKIDVSSVTKEEPPPPVKSEHPVGATPAKDMPVILGTEKTAEQVQPEIFGAVEQKEKSKAPIFIGILLGLAVIGAIAFFALRPKPVQVTNRPVAPVMTPEQIKAQEAERQRLEAEAKAARELATQKDEELKSLQDQLAKMQAQVDKAAKKSQAPAVDPAALKQLQDQAARLEEERKAQQALAEQKKKEADAAAAAQQAAADQQKLAQGTAPANSTEQPAGGTSAVQPTEVKPATPPPPEVKQVREGDLVDMGPDVIRPVVLQSPQPTYPPIAKARKIQGTVILSVLISEKGEPVQVKVLREAGGSSGLNEAAVAAIKKWKFQAAVKDGKRVKVWMTFPIKFSVQ